MDVKDLLLKIDDKDLLIITANCESPYLVSYYIAGIIPLFFFIFFVSFFLPAKLKLSVTSLNKDKKAFDSLNIKNKEQSGVHPVSETNTKISKDQVNDQYIDQSKSEFKDQNNLPLLQNRVLSLMFAITFCAIIYTQIFHYYPMIIVFNKSTPLAFDPFIYYSLMFLIGSYLLLCQMIYRYKKDLKKEEVIFLAFFIFSTLIILFQFNLIGMFMCLELFSISSYLLVTGLGSKVSIEASIKYALTGLLGTVFFLMGIIFCIVNYATVNLYDLSHFIRYDENLYLAPYLAICGSFFLIGIFLKLGVTPFHFWILDVYKGTSPITFIWLVTLSKVVLVFLLITILENILYYVSDYYEYVFLGLSLASIIVGSIGGLRQSNLKGLFAYSSLVTLGYILLPFTYYAEAPVYAITIAISTLVIYVFNLFGFFYFLSKFKKVSVIFNNLFEIKNIMRSNPILAFGFVISLFSFMGLPPLLGFYPKVILLNTLFQSGYVVTVAICIFCTLFTSFYYFLIIKQLTLSKKSTYINFKRLTIIDYFIIMFLLFMNCFIFFFFNNLMDFIYTLF